MCIHKLKFVILTLVLTACSNPSSDNFFGDTSRRQAPNVPGSFTVKPMGNEAGNGGDVVICGDQSESAFTVKSVRLLDLYEGATFPPKMATSMGGNGLNAQEKAHFVLDRLAKFDPVRAARYRSQTDQFFASENVRWVTDINLNSIMDTGQMVMQNGCFDEQIVIQRKPIYENQPRFVVQKDLWNKLDSENQAALVLHEVIYREALEMGQRDSFRTRKYNSVICSAKMESMTKVEYSNFMNALLVPTPFISFQSNVSKMAFRLNREFVIDGPSLLGAKGTGELVWSTLEPLPPWLKLDAVSGRVTGKYSDKTSKYFYFVLLVQDGLFSAFLPMNIEFLPEKGGERPHWLLDTFYVTATTTDVSKVDLYSLLVDGQTIPTRFMLSDGTPSWVSNSLDGKLTILPPKDAQGTTLELVIFALQDSSPFPEIVHLSISVLK